MSNGEARTPVDGNGGGGPTKIRDTAEAVEHLDAGDARLVAVDGNGGGGPTLVAVDGNGGGGPTKIRDKAVRAAAGDDTAEVLEDGAGPTGPNR
ncbi:hypothetical protein AB0I28_01085 [Phytomonospora sp. NPDC050363]|uniref:hypothetical protein n=1 Tax=Phytomonospora sp. NPDC050363 TaxID=3155642 RepID=UPI00340D2028